LANLFWRAKSERLKGWFLERTIKYFYFLYKLFSLTTLTRLLGLYWKSQINW